MSPKLRRLILQIHTWCGMFIAPFLVVMAISSLEFNHEIFSRKPWKEKASEYHLQLPASLGDADIPEAVKDSLGIYGYETYWTRYHDDSGYHFEIDRPGRHYLMVWDSTRNQLQATEQWTSIGTVLVGLHTIISANPGSPVFTLWQVYGQISMVLLFVMLVSSVWMWGAYAIQSRLEWGFALAAILIVGFFTWYLWQIG